MGRGLFEHFEGAADEFAEGFAFEETVAEEGDVDCLTDYGVVRSKFANDFFLLFTFEFH